MKSKSAALGLICLLVFAAAGCRTANSRNVTFTVGNTRISALVAQRGSATPTMINVHDDENTSVLAGRRVLREAGGRLIELAHDGRRFISFQVADTTFQFDPNRIFSDAGIRATLERRGAYNETAHALVKQFATTLLEKFALDREPVIIALHNTDGKGLTIHSYLATNTLSSAASQVHVSPQRAAGDFFYVTDRRFFDYLKVRDYNVTLQDDANVPDDGSLSVYFARRGIPYVNVEADVKHLDEQIEMVRTAVLMVRELGLTPGQ